MSDDENQMFDGSFDPLAQLHSLQNQVNMIVHNQQTLLNIVNQHTTDQLQLNTNHQALNQSIQNLNRTNQHLSHLYGMINQKMEVMKKDIEAQINQVK